LNVHPHVEKAAISIFDVSHVIVDQCAILGVMQSTMGTRTRTFKSKAALAQNDIL